MSLDLELDALRRDWSVDTEPLPELKRRVHRQNLRVALGAGAVVACLAIGTAIGIGQPRDSWWGGFLVGLWAACVVTLGYLFWVRRGTWRPATQTTAAYVALLHARAVAELKKMVFLRRALLVTLLGYGGFLLVRRQAAVWSGLLIVGLMLESVWIRRLEKRCRRDVEAAAALKDQDLEGPGSKSERTEGS